MEIRHYEEIKGVIPTADVVEGRFGLFTSHTWDNDFGSDTDLPGFKVPSTAAEAKKARWCITWAVDRRPFPAALSYPAYSYSLRVGAFEQTGNMPVALTLYGTNPAAQESLTIPSGYKSLVFKGGFFTLPKADYVASASLKTPGANVGVEYSGADAGKIKYISGDFDSDTCIGTVYFYDTNTDRLTIQVDE